LKVPLPGDLLHPPDPPHAGGHAKRTRDARRSALRALKIHLESTTRYPWKAVIKHATLSVSGEYL